MADGDSLADSEIIWRRAVAADFKSDGSCKSQLWRTDEVSVNRAALTDIETVAAKPSTVAVYAISVADVRRLVLGANVVEQRYDPKTKEDLGVDHAVILGIKDQKKAQRLRDHAPKIWPR